MRQTFFAVISSLIVAPTLILGDDAPDSLLPDAAEIVSATWSGTGCPGESVDLAVKPAWQWIPSTTDPAIGLHISFGDFWVSVGRDADASERAKECSLVLVFDPPPGWQFGIEGVVQMLSYNFTDDNDGGDSDVHLDLDVTVAFPPHWWVAGDAWGTRMTFAPMTFTGPGGVASNFSSTTNAVDMGDQPLYSRCAGAPGAGDNTTLTIDVQSSMWTKNEDSSGTTFVEAPNTPTYDVIFNLLWKQCDKNVSVFT